MKAQRKILGVNRKGAKLYGARKHLAAKEGDQQEHTAPRKHSITN